MICRVLVLEDDWKTAYGKIGGNSSLNYELQMRHSKEHGNMKEQQPSSITSHIIIKPSTFDNCPVHNHGFL